MVDVTKFYEGVPWSDFFLEFIRGEQTFTAEEEKKVLSEMMVFNSENLDVSTDKLKLLLYTVTISPWQLHVL